MIVLPILLAGVTVVGSTSAVAASAVEYTNLSTPAALSLRSAANAAAQRESLTLGRSLGARPPVTQVRRSGHYSWATRASAIFAGALIGAGGGAVVGGTIDAANGGECLTAMRYGMPIGAAVGAMLTSRLVR